MPDTEFGEWTKRMGRNGRPISDRDAARRLGLSRGTIRSYREGGRVPLYVLLACSALAFGLPAWRR